MAELTSYGFKNAVRDLLRYQHNLDDARKLDQLQEFFDEILEFLKKKGLGSALSERNFAAAAAFMEKRPEWKRLTPRDRERFESALKTSVGLKEPEATPE